LWQCRGCGEAVAAHCALDVALGAGGHYAVQRPD
jgi:hypothetical protein